VEHRATTDLCDHYGDEVQVAEGIFRHYGGRRRFGGEVVTVKVHEDNVLVRAALDEAGEGRVLVVDGGGSRRCALLGDLMAGRALEGGWAGVVVHGCVRDSSALAAMDLGVLALGANPRRSDKRGGGQRDVPVTFAGVRITPGAYLFADEDGVVVMEREPDGTG
jgi:regulator of ribonuclease activity A